MAVAHSDEQATAPELIGRLGQGFVELLSAELTLVRLEASEKLAKVLAAIGAIIFAAVFLMVALIFLLQGVVEMLVHAGWDVFKASFMVGGGVAVLALIAIFVAARRLSAARLRPERTIRQIKSVTDFSRGGSR